MKICRVHSLRLLFPSKKAKMKNAYCVECIFVIVKLWILRKKENIIKKILTLELKRNIGSGDTEMTHIRIFLFGFKIVSWRYNSLNSVIR